MATRVSEELKKAVSILYRKPLKEQKLYAKRIEEMLEDDFDRALDEDTDIIDKMAEEAIKEHRAGKSEPGGFCDL